MEKLTTQNCIIACQYGAIYNTPAHVPSISLCNIPCSVYVGLDGMSTILTLLKSRMSNSISSETPITFFGGVGRIDINNPNSFSESFVFDKLLKFIERPLVNPFIVSSRNSNSTQIFHNNNISRLQTGNNRSTYVMISPSHKPSPSSRKFFQLLSRTFRAFGLENTNKSVSTFPQGFNFVTIKNILRSDSEIINAQVHPKNFGMLVRSNGVFLSECKSKIMFATTLSKQTFSNLPVVKIIRSIFRNKNRNFNSSIDSSDTQNIIRKRETPRSVISNRDFIDDRISSFTFQYTTSHLNTGCRKLSRESEISQLRINERMESDIIFNSKNSSIVDIVLKPLFIEVDSINYDFSNFNFNRNTSNQHHVYFKNQDYLNLSILPNSSKNSKLNSAIPPTNEFMGILASNKIIMSYYQRIILNYQR